MRLCVAVPVLNEERIIADTCRQLLDFLVERCGGWTWEVAVVDNGSTDRTAALVRSLAASQPRLRYLSLDRIGKGYAVKHAWQAVDADVYCFMDADLATDLAALPALISAIRDGGYDVAVGSRFAPGAVVERDWLRRLASRGYQVVLKVMLHTHVLDAPCGFKAVSRRVRDQLLPQVKSGGWFFDSELLVLAERAGYRIKEIPVRWREPDTPGRKSKVRILSLCWGYLRSVLELKRRLRAVPHAASSKQPGPSGR